MWCRSPLLLFVASAIAVCAACGDNFITMLPDAGLGVGSSASTAHVGGSGGRVNGLSTLGGRDGADAGEPDSSDGRPCLVDTNCVDDDLCNAEATCINGFCQRGTPLTCNDGDPCTTDTCAPATGACVFAPVANGTVCLDGDRCDGQTCSNGVCTAGLPQVCADDGNSCTVRTCDRATGGCVIVPVPNGGSCSDGNLCNGNETCSNGFCLAGPLLNCNDSSSCTADSCDPLTGCSVLTLADGTTCSDGNLCNGQEVCIFGACVPGTTLTCNDGNPCTTETCNPITGACAFTYLANGVACPDGNLCDGQTCSNGVCVAGPTTVCANDNDNNQCTANRCIPATGVCVGGSAPDGTACPDADVCDGTERCLAGQCSVAGTPLVCADDGNPCTQAACAPGWGCVPTAVADGQDCTDANLCDGPETCVAGVCSATGAPLFCDDGNPCSANTCIPATGACSFPPVADGAGCPDTDPCNGVESCVRGSCTAGTRVICTLLRTCNPTTGNCEP